LTDSHEKFFRNFLFRDSNFSCLSPTSGFEFSATAHWRTFLTDLAQYDVPFVAEQAGFRPTEPHLRVAIIKKMALDHLADEELAARYRAAIPAEREQYIDELFRRNYSRVARWCLRFTSDRETAADLSQEIFTKAYQNLNSFQGQSKFSTWLFSIARNHCLNVVKANARQATELKADVEEDFLMDIPDARQDAYTALERASATKVVSEILNQGLDETEKIVFTLHYGDELPLDAISRLLNLENASGAKAYIVSAKRKLARLVQQRRARERHAQ
jgi:RNA polymerase sigma-70 factor (ECF subfamily)